MEKLFERLLELEAGWVVTQVDTDMGLGEVHIHVECRLKKCVDADSGETCKVYDHAPMRKWRHLDIMQYKTYICCRLPRLRLPTGGVRTVDPGWASSHERHTYLFEQMVIDLLQMSGNQTRTAAFMRCGFNVVNRIIHLSTRRGMERRKLQEHVLENLSIDEKSFKKGHKYITVLSDPRSGCVLDVEEDRTKEACRNLLDKTLTPAQQKEVRTVSMDMWKAFMNTVKEAMPQAEIVHDRFHLVKYLNDALDKVRRREVKAHELLRNSKYALLKNPENLTEKQRIKFEQIKAANHEVAKAWQVRENFKDLFASSTHEAFPLYMKWASDAVNKGMNEVSKVVEMFHAHMNGVLNALVCNFSNAMAERLNGKIQQLKSVARGYRTFANFRSAILFFHGGLDLYPLK
ncbi:MAG: ISL3 family transposase [Bacteroidetes bacterium]|nr:ISL3 family transposase [Bacteroidota bacterium]